MSIPKLQNPQLTIDIDAVIANYKFLANKCMPSKTAAVVKADCYGLGMAQIAPALFEAGCRTFFVATAQEALTFRQNVPEGDLSQETSNLYVFNGLPTGCAPLFAKNMIRPVLGNFEELAEWGQFCTQKGRSFSAALHFDTGMNRLGFIASDIPKLLKHSAFEHFSPSLVMSHLACADTPDHTLNQKQLKAFSEFCTLFPDAKTSLANSSGIFLSKAYHFDLTRPGICLYGGAPNSDITNNPMQQVATLEARILRLKTVNSGENIGYGGHYHTSRKTVLATLNVGYADGYLRHLSPQHDNHSAFVRIKGQKFPLIGRVSMDLIMVDVTDSKTPLTRHDKAEIIGQTITIDALAQHAGTISYEILTSLGQRYKRHYHHRKMPS